ncbi:hypothetical protein [Enterococcus timonensis]|uniref:hypothetical protein n=1 Tax=Enterococcus timonensis TaxID=1852364 RepID=UPI0008DA0FBE|nr:hypothetical protein [Enterococcus timonensis]
MFKNLKNLVAPKTIQEANYAIYRMVKLSIFMTVFSLPWTIVNTFITFSTETSFFFIIAFLLMIPNVMALFHFYETDDVTIKEYFFFLINNEFWKRVKVSLTITIITSFYLFDSYILIFLMDLKIITPILYITFMFLAIAGVYAIIICNQETIGWKKMIKKATYISWRYIFSTVLLFIILMVWVIIGYYIQGINIILGNSILWGIIYRIGLKKVK